jgi:hypothetical protein
MNLSYNILWFEDEFDSMKPLVEDIKKYVEDLGFKFEEPKIEHDNSNIDSINYEYNDLILMDYKFSGGDNGDVLINKIRSHNFFSEIVFYSSSEISDLRKAVLENSLDGVYCVGRSASAFLPTVQDVIKATVKKVLDVNTMRGIVMAETSDIDEKMITIISSYIETLKEDDKNQFLTHRRGELLLSIDEKRKKIEDNAKFYNEWIFDSSHKWRTVLEIVKKNLPEKKKLTSLYHDEIIIKRNKLAHLKISENVNGEKQLVNGDFIFNDMTCKEILNNLKKHEKNIDEILLHFS